MKNSKNILLWVVQLICAAILFRTSYAKLSHQTIDVAIFSKLGMEPTGRYLIGIIEGLSALFLLHPHLCATGALLAFGTMLGALIAHLSILGFSSKLFFLWFTVLSGSLIILVGRRYQLPLIGKILNNKID